MQISWNFSARDGVYTHEDGIFINANNKGDPYMKPKHTFWLLLAAVLALPTAALAQDDAPQGPTPTDDGVAVTIYNQGQAIVQDRRTLRIREGQNVIDFTDVAAQIDPTSVSFASLTAPESTTVLEQNYVYDLVGADALYRRYIDQEIRLVLSDGTELTGVLAECGRRQCDRAA